MRLLICIYWLGCVVNGSGHDKPQGVFVNKNNPDVRVEFRGDQCFLRRQLGFVSKGHYSQVDDEYICHWYGESEFRFRRSGQRLIDQHDAVWVNRKNILDDMPWQTCSPVTLQVVDRKSRQPITRFAYEYRIYNSTANFDPLFARPIEVNSENGSFEISAPTSCAIHIHLQNQTIIDTSVVCHLTSTNLKRELVIPVDSGKTLSGRVIESSSGQPIAGARIAPLKFVNPLMQSDDTRCVSTDENGKFTISGLDPKSGIEIQHRDYFPFRAYGLDDVNQENKSIVTFELKKGERLFGWVFDATGQPLPNVFVDEGTGKTAMTNQRGRFELQSPEKWDTDADGNPAYYLDFEKTGFLGITLNPKSADNDGIAVVLHPQPLLKMVVVDGDGNIAGNCQMAAGAGTEPEPWCCTEAQIDVEKGFGALQIDTNLDYDESGKVWVGVNSPGFAFWEKTVDAWKGTKQVQAILVTGHTVTGSVGGSQQLLSNAKVELVPDKLVISHDSEPTQRQMMARRNTSVDKHGNYTFTNIANGDYTLAVHGPTISPFSSKLSVKDSDVTVGEIAVDGRGSIKGIANEPWNSKKMKQPWAFKEGYIDFVDNSGRSDFRTFNHLKPIRFVTDENGHFHIDGVPTGAVEIRFDPAPLSDIRLWIRNKANVIANKTSIINPESATHDGFRNR